MKQKIRNFPREPWGTCARAALWLALGLLAIWAFGAFGVLSSMAPGSVGWLLAAVAAGGVSAACDRYGRRVHVGSAKEA